MYMLLLICDDFAFFFFKPKTAYDMRISDWSSDVCSSDLIPQLSRPEPRKGFIANASGERQKGAACPAGRAELANTKDQSPVQIGVSGSAVRSAELQNSDTASHCDCERWNLPAEHAEMYRTQPTVTLEVVLNCERRAQD